MSESAHPLVGTVINNQYRVERKLGEGGMGMVFAARHTRLAHLKFAIKLLVSKVAHDEKIRARFFREADAVSRLNHPNIIRVVDFGELPDGQHYLVMPLLTGRPLDEYLRTAEKLGPHHALSIVAQVASGLRHAHGQDIVHRDLKPPNIFIERQNGEEVVKVLDFGIAKDARDPDKNAATQSGTILGTLFYMACEQYGDAATATPAADVFSLAVVLVEMVTGRLPWDCGGHPSQLYWMQRQESPTLGPELPRAWRSILERALLPDPAQRFQTAREFVLALADGLEALPPLWKDGRGIVHDVARDLITDVTADDATVRSGSGQGAASGGSISNHAAETVTAKPSAQVITANERPIVTLPAPPSSAVGAPSSTTTGASIGSMNTPVVAPTDRPRGGLLVALGIGVAVAVGGGLFAVAQLRNKANAESSDVRKADVGESRSVAPLADASSAGVDSADVVRVDAGFVVIPLDAGSVVIPADAAVAPPRLPTSKTGTRKHVGTEAHTPKTEAGSASRQFDPDAAAGKQ